MQQDGSFRYGYYPRFDRVIPGYNCMRHAGTIWSLLCQYRITKKASVLSLAARSIDYLLSHALVYRDPDTAYLSEPLKDEIKLGGGGVLILAITEYLICASRSLVLKFCVPGRLSQRLRMRKFCIQGTCSRSRKLCDAAIPKLPALSETEFSPC